MAHSSPLEASPRPLQCPRRVASRGGARHVGRDVRQHQQSAVVRPHAERHRAVECADILARPHVAHAAGAAAEAGHVCEGERQLRRLLAVVHQQHRRLAAAPLERLVQVLPRRHPQRRQRRELGRARTGAGERRVGGGELQPLGRLLEGAARIAGVSLADCEQLAVREDRPDRVHDGEVGRVVRQRERRRDDGPRREVGARLGDGEALVAAERAGEHPDLEHVGVRPAARVREVASRKLKDGLQVADDRAVRCAHVARRAVKVPRAPGGGRLVRPARAPVAVLHHDGGAAGRRRRRLDEVAPQLHVGLRAAPVQLPRVEPHLAHRPDVARVEAAVARLLFRADAVVAVPACRQPEGVGVRGHALHRREALGVDERVALLVVVRIASLAVPAARLPVVVEADVAEAEVAEGGGHAVNSVAGAAPDHAGHDALDQRLVHVAAVQVPRAPAERWQPREPILGGARGGGEEQPADHRLH
mmetsp:Transcript_26803/g.80360  ORF Transcript_26803/g.80360 Transcript_26803/m.80360 type:complete len:475 (+) Transcript_26803:116-1540(+)